jgi:hypothetical protein
VKLNPVIFALASTSFFFAPFCGAVEKKISASDLPPAVQKTAQEQSIGATVKGYSLDKENGQVEYEVEMTVNGHSKDVTIAPDGSVVEVEEQVQMGALPTSVQSALKDKAGNGTITKVESITKRGKIVAYEAAVKTASRHSEIQVGPNGESLAHEE